MADKRVIFTIHATNRLLERKITLADISTILKKGARLGDLKTGETLCIYKVGTGQYHTLVIEGGGPGADNHHNRVLLQQLAG